MSSKERIFSTDNLHLRMIIDGRSFSGCLFLHCMQGESLTIHAGVFVSSRFLWCSISAKNQAYGSTSNFTVVNIGVLTQHPTLQLFTPDFTVIYTGLYSWQHRTFHSSSNFTVINIGLLTKHPTLQLSTTYFIVSNIGLLTYHPTLQLSTTDYWLNIQLCSCQKRTFIPASNLTVIGIGVSHVDKTNCKTLQNTMFVFVTFDVEFSACVPNSPIIMGLAEWRHCDVSLARGKKWRI